jgi:PAS domain S-box-containing protein
LESAVGFSRNTQVGHWFDANALLKMLSLPEKLVAGAEMTSAAPTGADPDELVIPFDETFGLQAPKWLRLELHDRFLQDSNTSFYWTFTLLGLASLLILLIAYGVSNSTVQRLWRSERRFDLAMDAVNDGLWDWDIVNGHVYYSASWARMLGEDQVDNDIMAWQSRIHPADKPRVLQALQHHIEGGNEFWSQEHRLRCADGNWLWVLGRGRTVERDKAGKPLRMVGTLTDITARRHAIAELAQSEVRFRTVFEASRDAILLQDGAVFVDCNPAALILVGATRKDQIIGLSPADFLVPDPDAPLSAEERTRQVTRAALSGELDFFEWPIRRLDGKESLLEVRLTQVEIDGRTLNQSIVRDITARKQAEAVIKELGQMFQAVMDTTKDGFYLVDMEGRLLEVNETYCQFSGYSRKELLAMRIPQLDHIEQPEDVRQRISQMTLEGGFIFQTQHRRRNGSVWDVEVSASYSPIQGGRIFSFVRDITEQKRNAAELEQYRQHLEQEVETRTSELNEANRQLLDTHLAMDHAGIGIHWVNAETGRILYVNNKAAEMLGYDPEEMLGLSVPDIDPNFPPGDFKSNTDALFAGGTAHFETTQKHKDGSLLPIDITGYMMPEEEGEPRRFITFNTDISERKTAEERNRRLLDILDMSPDFISTATIDGEIRFLNPAGHQLVGLPGEVDLHQLHIPDFHPEWSSRKVEQEAIPTTFLSKGVWQGETALLHRDGHEIPVFQTILVHRDGKGRPGHLSTIARDITRQKADEDAMIAAKQASEAANVAKGAFLANMSHEIRTPMNAILGMTHLLLDKSTKAEERDRLVKIDQAGHHLISIINDILDFSKIEADKLVLARNDFDPQALLRQVASLIGT